MKHLEGRSKIFVAFGILFLAVTILLILIFFAGKKTYVVRFDLDGGTLISGSLEQHVTQGQDATPPVTVKDGAYLLSWSASYRRITKDIVITAVWEYETTSGIVYTTEDDWNYAEISGSYPYLNGEVYLGAHYGEKKVLGITQGAFADRIGITKVYLLDGLLRIEDKAFFGCTALAQIEIPETVTHLGADVFRGCESLESVVLNEGLLSLGSGAFADCTALKEIVLPESLTSIAAGAFEGCDGLVIKIKIAEEDAPEAWEDGWYGDAELVWEYEEPLPEKAPKK